MVPDSSVSQVSGERAMSSAAYLLFYRRRSAEPLGPPYLRELVEKARNPVPEGNDNDHETSARTAENSDDDLAGEDSLGGPRPFSHLHGSSSDGTKAGAGARIPDDRRPVRAGQAPNGGGLAAGQLANQSVRTTMSNDGDVYDEGVGLDYDDDEGVGIGTLGGKTLYGPPRPPAVSASQGGGWSFDNIMQPENMSLSTTANNTPSDDGGDAASDRAMALGSDDEVETDTRLMEDFGSDRAYYGMGNTTPLDTDHDGEGEMLFHDSADDDLYEDAGSGKGVDIGADMGLNGEEGDPPLEEVRLSME